MPKRLLSPPVGSRVGDWLVLANHDRPHPKNPRWVVATSRVRCTAGENGCGSEREVADATLRSGKSRGCGCERGRRLAASGITHGKTLTRLYRLWANIKYRLKDSRSYEGILMHAAWTEDFEAFEKYINENLGPLPAPDYSLDRIDPHGNYEPGNLRWADKKVQAQNRTNSVSRRFQQARSGVDVGARFFMLTVLELTTGQKHGRNWYTARVRCDCGAEKTVVRRQLLRGRTKSCGCFKARNLAVARKVGRQIVVRGVSDSLAGWARTMGVTSSLLCKRLNKLGWTPEQAVLTPKGTTTPIPKDGE